MSTFRQLKMEQRIKKAKEARENKSRALLIKILGTDYLIGEEIGYKFSGPKGFVDAFVTSMVPKVSTTHDFEIYAIGKWYTSALESDSSAYRSIAGNITTLMGGGIMSNSLYVRRCHYESGYGKEGKA